ncbi:hypothetical protein CIPAW_01G073100 [Carya illinoinensis]|uniref:Uncharacterized protein n=1 Tax=Carya illinoinensis TaxID=32201 RepID=A0A8T1RIY9_CARIL|nr:hypothetical protein CIPAW_01G073100 [Carya illinoinensis]
MAWGLRDATMGLASSRGLRSWWLWCASLGYRRRQRGLRGALHLAVKEDKGDRVLCIGGLNRPRACGLRVSAMGLASSRGLRLWWLWCWLSKKTKGLLNFGRYLRSWEGGGG